MNRHRRHYSELERAVIRSMHPTASPRTIAAMIGRTPAGVKQEVAKMGLRRTAAQKSAIYRTWKRSTPTKHERAARRLEAELYDLAALEREASMMAPGRDRVWVAEERR
jgi:IS30 family transposase